jgi:hypothetical protein
MSLTDIFSIPFLICLAICVLLIGCSSIYFYQKISHQDHKIESMVSLITSLAEEQIKTTSPTVASVPIVKPATVISFGGSSNGKIPVSDDEESSSEEEYSSSEEEDEDETSSEEDGSECEDEEPKIQVEELNLEKLVDEVFDLEELDSKEPEPSSVETDIKSIHLEADEKITDFSSVFKTIHINMTEDESVGNYKKMSLTKLREVAQSLGHGDTSKLKKNELLKLLEAE